MRTCQHVTIFGALINGINYRRFFANVQQLVERAVIGSNTEVLGPAPIAASFKPFPWPAVHIDLGVWIVGLRNTTHIMGHACLFPQTCNIQCVLYDVYGRMLLLCSYWHLQWLCELVRKTLHGHESPRSRPVWSRFSESPA